MRVFEDVAMGTPLVNEVQMGDAEAGTSRKVAPITDFGKVRKKFYSFIHNLFWILTRIPLVVYATSLVR